MYVEWLHDYHKGLNQRCKKYISSLRRPLQASSKNIAKTLEIVQFGEATTNLRLFLDFKKSKFVKLIE